MLTAEAAWAGFFIERWGSRLREEGIEVVCVVIDENRTRRANPVRHVLSVAKGQAKVARSSVAGALVRSVVFRLWTHTSRHNGAVTSAALPETVPCFRVSSLNSAETVKAVRACGADASCLLGARILSQRTIQELGHLILNGHASDPAFVRGRPPVIWEVLNGNRHICLTVHQVIARLDAGPIYGQRLQEIIYCGGIGATMRATMEEGRVRMTDLFAEVLSGLRAGAVTPKEFTPGPVRTIPTISQLIRAEMLCRKRSRVVPALRNTALTTDGRG
ncbi:MAG: formyltransferase family protein [Verrucomicrobiota bacterium]